MKGVGCRIMSLLSLCLVAMACGVIYDDEGDCSVTYRVKFRYDWNLKYSDAFAHEVESVTLYLLDKDGNIVWQKTESGEALKDGDYAMTVDVEPGVYDMLAWCGTTDKGSFEIPAGAKVREDLTCTLVQRTDSDGNSADVRGDIDRLFHGWLPDQTFGETEGVYTYTVPLKKDTNNIRVVLQQLSGLPIDEDRFTFIVSAENGAMDWDNELMPDEHLDYYAWSTRSGTAGVDLGNGFVSSYSAVVAELTTARLMTRDNTASRRSVLTRADENFPAEKKMRLNVIDNETGKMIISIPLVDYALLVKGEYRKDMDDQEFLDRMDEYSIVFVLDEGWRWVNMSINIHSWKHVYQNASL
ncbi:MAG: FimB/Mfa2 family fimbrial subunit [Clostridium sp.]|nr:FimB/Mfa2 family fimbrial subunit [Clostridium sp.]